MPATIAPSPLRWQLAPVLQLSLLGEAIHRGPHLRRAFAAARAARQVTDIMWDQQKIISLL